MSGRTESRPAAAGHTETSDTEKISTGIDAVRVDAEHGYLVHVGRGIVERVAGALGEDVRQVLLLHPAGIAELATGLAGRLRDGGLVVHEVEHPDGEAAKTIDVAARCWSLMGRAALTRSDAVVGLGGGATTDLAGFVAATWLRGVSVVQVPTTVLGMVDAAVGGKTGINTPEGKNLVGAFHSPRAVICDLDHLRTLPAPDHVAGLAEVIKTGFIADEHILRIVEADGGAAARRNDSAELRELITRSIQVKARVVSSDFTETGLREILNYGHTFGHAIEQVEGFRWRHGEAVAVGMVYAAELAHLAGLMPADLVARHREVLRLVGLPTSYRGDRWEDLRLAMGRDKKNRGTGLRFVTLAGIGEPRRLETSPTEELLRGAYAAVSS